MSAARSLLRIELKRSVGLLLFPLLLLAAWYGASINLYPGIYVWLDTSSAVRQSVPFLGALAGGISAWMAGRGHRRGVEEMLRITPRPSVARDLTAWTGTAFWCVAAYLLFAAVLSVLTWQDAVWGGPLPGYFLVGLLAMVAYSALGYAAGYWVPSRFTAPLLAIGIIVWELSLAGPIGIDLHLELLSAAPVSLLPPNLDVFQKIPQVALQQSLWFLGLGGTALVVVVLKNAWSNRMVWVSLFGAIAITTVGLVTSLAAAQPLQDPVVAKPAPFEPVCDKGKITVCVHPAYAKLLPKTSTAVNRVAKPLEGIPGAPTRAVQESDYGPLKRVKNTVYFSLDSLKYGDTGMFKEDVAMSLVTNYYAAMDRVPAAKPTKEVLKRCGERVAGKDHHTLIFSTQMVVQKWLVERAGAHSDYMYFVGDICPNTDKLTKRFAKLDPAKRKAWLEKNFADLRAGKLTLKDLP